MGKLKFNIEELKPPKTTVGDFIRDNNMIFGENGKMIMGDNIEINDGRMLPCVGSKVTVRYDDMVDNYRVTDVLKDGTMKLEKLEE